MKRYALLAFLAFIVGNGAEAQDVSPTDLSRYEVFEEGVGIATLSDLEEMEEAYQALLADGNCADAIPAIIEFYETANMVSNLIRRGNEPYYDARRDDQEVIARDRALLNELASAERASNSLIRQRNRAWVEEARCLLEQGESQAAVTRLYRALDYIDADELALWREARTLLWQQVGFGDAN